MLNATPILACFARHRIRKLRGQRPEETQATELLRLLRIAKDTRFGKAHGFANIGSVEDFQARVPLRRYEDFWTDYWKPDFPRIVNATWPGLIPYFAVTSGTSSGVTKYIPCTREMVLSNKRASLDLLSFHIQNRPESRLLGGRNFMLGGSTGLHRLAPNVFSGDLSGIAAATMPWWARLRYFPPRGLEEIPDWREKIERLAPLSLERDIRSISGTPSWLLMFFEKLAALRPGAERRLSAFYPNLELLVHGGVNFAPYRKLFATWLEGGRAETREAYAASEGFIAVADRGDGEGLRLTLDNGLFFEFVPLEELDDPQPTRHWIANVETGVNYAVVLSNCSGLWAYVVGDTVRFVDRQPPRVLVTGRVSYTLSAFGEHLIDEEIEESITAAADTIGAAVADYSVGALFPDVEGAHAGHLFIVEFAHETPDPKRLAAFARALDTALSQTNEDYAAHRADDFGMAPPRVHAVPPGRFAKWMEARGQLGGQHKVPRIVNDQTLFRDLRDFMGCD
jgi:hypothetical protein